VVCVRAVGHADLSVAVMHFCVNRVQSTS